MELEFENPRHERLVNDFEALGRKYNKKGVDNATSIISSIDALRAAETLYDVPYFLRPHPLQGNFKGCFAIDVENNDTHRVIFRPNEKDNPDYRIDNPKSISKIEILKIFHNYHG